MLFPVSGSRLLPAQAPLGQQFGTVGISKPLPCTGGLQVSPTRSFWSDFGSSGQIPCADKPELVEVKGSVSWEKVGVFSRENSQC